MPPPTTRRRQATSRVNDDDDDRSASVGTAEFLDDAASVYSQMLEPDVFANLTPAQHEAMRRFCACEVSMKAIAATDKEEITQLLRQQRECRSLIESEMRGLRQHIVELPRTDEDLAMDESIRLPRFARLKPNTTTRTITPSLIAEVVSKVSWGLIEQAISIKRAQGETATPRELFVDVVCDVLHQLRTQHKESVTLTNSMARAISDDDDGGGPTPQVAFDSTLNQACRKLHAVSLRLGTLRNEQKARKKPVVDTRKVVEPDVLQIMKQSRVQSHPVTINDVEGRFYLRLKRSERRPPLKVKDLRESFIVQASTVAWGDAAFGSWENLRAALQTSGAIDRLLDAFLDKIEQVPMVVSEKVSLDRAHPSLVERFGSKSRLVAGAADGKRRRLG